MIYKIQFEDADDGGVGAYLPDMPGVVAVGRTRAEAIMMLDEAVRWHVEALLIDGSPLPEPVEEVTQYGQWSIVLDHTYVAHVSAALESIVSVGTSNLGAFGDAKQLKLRVHEQALEPA